MTKRALEGIRVLELAYLGITPVTIKMLAMNGAEVVRVESHTRMDPLRTSGPFIDGKTSPEHSGEIAHIHSDKFGLTLNLKHPQGVRVARRLAAWADIVADGFTTGTLDALGLGYNELVKINPDIIMFSSNTFGQTGPLATFPSTGIHLTGMTGFTEITGWPDRGPVALGYYSDFIVPHFNLLLIMAALDYRRRTGKGQHIDLAQCEAALYFNAPAIMGYSINGQIAKRPGNRSPYAAPHGVYSCQGDDQWCAISVSGDEEWHSFCEAIGNPSWTEDPKFSTFLGRKENEDELDRLVEVWTANRTPQEVMGLMQAAGIAAGVVQDGKESFNDPQLKHYDYIKWLYYSGIQKEFPTEMPFSKLSRTPAEVRMPRPAMGEHNEYICTKILGMTDEEFVSLMNEGVFE